MTGNERRALYHLRRHGHTVMSPRVTRLLSAIIEFRASSRKITIRGLGKRLGVSSPHGVHHLLLLLRSEGLVSWEPGAMATIRPTCRFIPAKEFCRG